MTDDSKQAVEASPVPDAEPPKAKTKKSSKVEETPREVPPNAGDAAASESPSHSSETAAAASDANSAERMRFRRIRKR